MHSNTNEIVVKRSYDLHPRPTFKDQVKITVVCVNVVSWRSLGAHPRRYTGGRRCDGPNRPADAELLHDAGGGQGVVGRSDAETGARVVTNADAAPSRRRPAKCLGRARLEIRLQFQAGHDPGLHLNTFSSMNNCLQFQRTSCENFIKSQLNLRQMCRKFSYIIRALHAK